MRSIARMGLLVAVLSTVPIASARAPYTIPDARPTSIKQIKEVLRGGGAKESIPEYLEKAMCGGWDKEISIGEGDENGDGFPDDDDGSYIPNVWGVPGRDYRWYGDLRSGMGTRYDRDDADDDVDNEFQYPGSADGLATPCEKNRSSTEKDVWEWKQWWDSYDPVTWEFIEWVPEYELRKHSYQYPEIHDPACRWRMEGGRWPDWPLTPDKPPVPWDQDSVEYEEPPSCYEFCQYLNSFVYEDCLEPYQKDFWVFVGWDEDNVPQFAPITVWTCDAEDVGLKYICTDEKVDEGDWRQACDAPHPDVEEWANARKCVGEQCRCGNGETPQEDVSAEKRCVRVKDEPELAAYESYYRHYSGAGYSREALDQYVAEDVSSKSFDLACYGFYNEFDPKYHQTQKKDRRCVINIDVENMKESQKGKGEYKEGEVKDKDPTDPNNQRPGGPRGPKEPTNDPPIPGHYNIDTDTWYQKLGGAFSFVNEKLFEQWYEKDLGNVFLAYDELDHGKQEATPQINDERLLAESNLMRAFDDTAQPRAYVRWWQAQQTRMSAIMRAPVLRIVLPSAWFVGLDPDDPFLSTQAGSEISIDRADRSDRIELQLEADEDVLGTALAYIERSVLLHVEEEPIPVVVPMGSPAEFRSRARDWCEWYKAENGAKNCDDAPEEVKKVMERLEEYAKRIDDVRELRAELSETAGATLDLQRRLLEPIATWFKDNEGKLKALIRGRERAELELLPEWKKAQAQVIEMHERTNLPWCMNQRYTSPVYSLLDPWLPSRGESGSQQVVTGELGLPQLPTVERPEDVIIDFSAVTAMSGTIKLPVLKPVQIRIDIPTPPTPRELAELPDIQLVRDAMKEAIGEMPEVDNQLSNPPTQEPPPPLSESLLNDGKQALGKMLTILKGMNERYKKFWGSIGPLEPPDPDKPNFDELNEERDKKQKLRCKEWDTNQCQHVEMDLWERVLRIGSRPLVQLKEDFKSIGTARTEATVCLPEDDACQILNPERTDPGFRWEVRGSAANDAPIDALKLKIIKLTQPPPLGDVDPILLSPHDDDPAPLQGFHSIRLLP